MPRNPDHSIAIKLIYDFINNLDWNEDSVAVENLHFWIEENARTLSLSCSTLETTEDAIVRALAFEVATLSEQYIKDPSEALKEMLIVFSAFYLGLLNDRDYIMKHSEFGSTVHRTFMETKKRADDFFYNKKDTNGKIEDDTF